MFAGQIHCPRAMCVPECGRREPVTVTTAAMLQKADLHVSKAAVRSMTAPDGLLVEMPPGFDVTGDTGSIGRFNATSDGTNASVEMDIKGDKTPAACGLRLLMAACCSLLCAAQHDVLWGIRCHIMPSSSACLRSREWVQLMSAHPITQV